MKKFERLRSRLDTGKGKKKGQRTDIQRQRQKSFTNKL